MPPATVFVSNLDLYLGGQLGKYLANAVVGKTQAEDEDEDEEEGGGPPKETYTVVGTLSDSGAAAPRWATVIDGSDKAVLATQLLAANIVIWDISPSEADAENCAWAVQMLADQASEYDTPKTFVCASTLLTWAKTKPADPEDTESPVLEEEYKRRRPHMKYKPHIDVEKLVIKCGKTDKKKLKTYVAAAGVTYGGGEDALHGLFKDAWHQQPELLYPGEGANVLPMIHVLDFAACVVNIIEASPETKYVVCCDEARHTLLEVVTTIAENLGTKKVTAVPETDAGPFFAAEPRVKLDSVTMDLRVESGAIKDMNVPWIAQSGFVEAIGPVIAEYKASRNLHPHKIAVLGPPTVGLLPYCEALCKHYKLHHVHRQGVIEETVARLRSAAELIASPGFDDLPAEVQDAANEDKELLETLGPAIDEANYEEEMVTGWVRAKLRSMPCLNQGYVLNGYPETKEIAEALFAPGDDAEDPDAPDPLTVPEFVFAPSASDEFLRARAMQFPENTLQFMDGAVVTEAEFDARVAAYRAKNTDEKSVLNYFDFREIHPVYYDVEQLDGFIEVPTTDQLVDGRPAYAELYKESEVVKKMIAVIGGSRNYGLTPAEKAALEEEKALQAAAAAEVAANERVAKDAIEAANSAEQAKAWRDKLSLVKQEEREALEASASPLRTFLMRHVMPTLSEGLVEVSQARPDDPVDFLAEYLFRANPIPHIN